MSTSTPSAATAAVPIRRALHRWMEIGVPRRRQLFEPLEQRAFIGLQPRLELRRDRETHGARERFRDLVGREDADRARVHLIRVRLERQRQHHVREVHRLTPRRRPDLQARHVDQLEMAVLHQEVGRLDVAVRDAQVPEPSDQHHPLVDHDLVDVGVAQRLRVLEELGDEHVLGVRRQLHDAVRAGDPDARVAEEPQRVVLEDDQTADRADRRLVLELSIEDRPADPVPAVRADVRGRVDLPERARSVLQGHPQGGRPAGPFQAERLDLGDDQAQLVAHRAHDGIAALAAQIQVRRVAALAERHREHVLGHEPAERELGHGDRQDPAVEARDQEVGGEVEAQDHLERR